MALPLEQRLNTNYTPSDEELQEIPRILVEPQARLARMNDEIERAHATLDALKRQRDELAQLIDQYQALTSPIRRIPPEILQEIFINCLPTDHPALMSEREAPLLIGRVCSSWRSISQSTPELWTSVHVSVPHTTPITSRTSNVDYVVVSNRLAKLRTAALQEWLQRSGSLPVDISFSQWQDGARGPFNFTSGPQPIVDTILSVSRRWRKFTIAAQGPSMLCLLTRPHDLPLLETLDLRFPTLGQSIVSDIPKSECNVFRTPSLRRLFLSHGSGDYLDYPVDWANLTDLAIEGYLMAGLRLQQAVYLLSQCPQLIRCSLEISTPEEAPTLYSPLTLFNLRCLSIFDSGVDATSMFDCLDLPALREVEYHTTFLPSPHRKPSLLALLRKSNGRVQKLTTDPKRFIMEDLIQCLHFIPDATTLTLKPSRLDAGNRTFDPTILDKELLYSFLPSASDTLCPELKFLEIDSPFNFSSQDLLEFILEKQSNALSDISKLNRIKIVFPHSRREDIMPQLTEFVQEGLDIHNTLLQTQRSVCGCNRCLQGVLEGPQWGVGVAFSPAVLIVTMRERQRLKTFPTILESVATQCNTDIRPRQIALLNLPPQLRLAFLRALGLLSASRLFAFVSSILFVFVRGRRWKFSRPEQGNIAKRLNTNYAPSDEELQEIARILVEPQGRLAGMNDEIERAQATLDALKRQRDELARLIDQYRALTSPIRRIPREILQEIFTNCIPTDHPAVMSEREAPLLIGRVCSSWRSMSQSTPELWTSIHVSIPGTTLIPSRTSPADYALVSNRVAELRTAALQEWLQRSASLPVDISFIQGEDWTHGPFNFNRNTSLKPHPVVDTILSVSRRWRKLTVAAQGPGMVSLLTQPSDLPLLETLDLTFPTMEQSIVSEVPKLKCNVFRTPSLRRLSLFQSSGDCLDYPVDWANLTDLAIEGYLGEGLRLHQAMYLLSQCPQLIRCSLEISMPEEAPHQYSPLTLYNLRCLSIFEGVDITSMFENLDLPALREVEYHTSLAPNPHKKPSLLTLLRKSSRSVQKFTTDPKRLLMEDLIECLHFIPDVTTLTLKPARINKSNRWFDPTFLDKKLLYSFLPSASDTLCPKLKVLEIDSPFNFSSQDLLGFILEKQSDALSDITKLERIKIVFPHSRREDIMPQLTEFVQGGLDIQLIYTEPLAMAMFSPSRGLPTAIWA
ncbi:uncharacterized protein LACBIDRAFT_329425 [Laccaria bicolor S238N-H82]|uniref:Predicted protein n=1 Tax=Laccaria bicolor (strain S238N-H82 / ATCC MYA-4686) TaxID=486041 RepID=B0DHZ4_LACBS|nr:uncharacterized protein LACBIDRAFT_329425 [Laccaria bicolor S238N-H82]EDR05815.1 predicted protein [Laccaria bicolor S238N-H82]|eukprot:XP_001883491.1 predicted protein [Laccaria bicolor S238N-H82]